MNVFLLPCLLTGCVAPQLPPADFSQPGWTVRDVPALWRPSAAAEEMTGELLWAKRDDDESLFVQFSKGGLPLLVARKEPTGWSLSSSLRSGAHGGRGRPPKMLPWFQLTEMPPVSVAPPWVVEVSSEGHWVLTHPRSGETLEGVVPVP